MLVDSPALNLADPCFSQGCNLQGKLRGILTKRSEVGLLKLCQHPGLKLFVSIGSVSDLDHRHSIY